MNVLVTGGAGYIGSHTAKALVHAGFIPVVFDNLSRGNRWALKFGEFAEGDLSDKVRIRQVLAKHKIEAVIHFAAYINVGESVPHPELYFRNNTANALTLLEAMHEENVRRIVFSSTAAVYGDPQTPILPETHPKNPVNPYGESKLAVENMLKWFSPAFPLGYVALRYFNASGADPDGEVGEAHDPETHLIPRIIFAAQGKLDAIDVFGTDYETADGTAIRDYVHVLDLADAHIRALGYLEQGGASTAFNLGSGRGFSVKEVIDMVEKVSGRKVPVRYGPRRAGDPPMLIADSTRANEILGWKAQYSLEEIVRTAWNWHGKQG